MNTLCRDTHDSGTTFTLTLVNIAWGATVEGQTASESFFVFLHAGDS